MQPITTKLPTSSTARARRGRISAAEAERDPGFACGQRLTLDQLVAHVTGELASLEAPDSPAARERPCQVTSGSTDARGMSRAAKE